MFQKRLKQHFLEILLTTSTGNIYTGGEILKRVEMLTRAFSCIGVDSSDTVGIYCKNEMYTVATIMACMSYGVDFVVLPYNEDFEDTKVKMVLSNVTHGLLVSEEIIDVGTLTLNPGSMRIIVKGWYYNTLSEDEKIDLSKIFDVVHSIVEEYNTLDEYSIDLPANYKDSTREICINFHNGISRGIFNASVFSHKDIYLGLKDVTKDLYDATGKAFNDTIKGPLLTVEPPSSLYDIINGIIAPILQGVHVIIGNSNTLSQLIESMHHNETKMLYINSNKFTALLTLFQKEVPRWLKFFGLQNYFIRRKFNQRINSSIKHIIITGKIDNYKLLNSIKRKYTVLYTMSEVSSIIAYGEYIKLPKHIWLTPRSNMLLTTTGGDNEFGEINIQTTDLFKNYLLEKTLEEYFNIGPVQSQPKDAEGNFRTEDIGLLRNGKLLIKDKAKNIFINENGIIIETGKILSSAKRFKEVKEATVAIINNNIVLIIEPDFDLIEANSLQAYKDDKNVKTFEERMLEIKDFINNRISMFSKIHKIIVIHNPEGLYRKNFKIVSRHF